MTSIGNIGKEKTIWTIQRENINPKKCETIEKEDGEKHVIETTNKGVDTSKEFILEVFLCLF